MTTPTKVKIKSGDKYPYLAATLGGGPSSWTGATCEIAIRRYGCPPGDAVRYAATTFNDVTKAVTWDYGAFDTTIAGSYEYEWIVTFSGGKEMTAPNDALDLLIIVESA